MAWARLDDNANGAAKLIALSDGAYRLYVAGLVYCQRNLTNGAIPRHAVATFGVRAKHLERLIAEELCRTVVPGKGPLWHETDAGWEVHDYLDWNDDRASVLAERSRAAERKAAWRGRASATSLRRGDRADAAAPPTRDATQDRTRDTTGDETPASGGDGTEDLRRDRPPDGARDGPGDRSRDGHRSGCVPERGRNGRSTSTTTDDLDRGRRDRSQDQEQPAGAGDVHAVLVKVAHTVLDDIDAVALDSSDAKEQVKMRAARAGIPYDAAVVTRALDSAEMQRRSKGRRLGG